MHTREEGSFGFGFYVGKNYVQDNGMDMHEFVSDIFGTPEKARAELERMAATMGEKTFFKKYPWSDDSDYDKNFCIHFEHDGASYSVYADCELNYM